ncbi:MAG: D-tyrosyl-tRNA(Tyr) deacylase [Gammaproteobacteria bacterium]|nr:D-tyrosyl-tRNA(Tyr) deacylase [Gammaproteobacteria bacterium]NIO61814.1 D-tyrosyl-tRNA(Tyr) deacylase [Gammaproteobacteria bacterium]NIP48685.1 D-tyrosyl-tRNA(Tyr) deacylase [Gammaproteobacteria bacterium]NIQ09137.1 D-tyrosyl-tRNA(Tyr) deacylase [Gammaproteobacteria bacterium]NIQ19065.1 D-tyrosyl-tRNA(Tyr) deacylase [Gammaproteobacteria bacterium]
MIGLLQRVSHASVSVEGSLIGKIDRGLVVFVGIEKTDSEANADRLLQRLLGYRVFADKQNRMNLSLLDVYGGLLLIPQFTLPADTRKGMRPSFSNAASPEFGKRLFDYLLEKASESYELVEAGQFAANMQVTLTNDGPVTFWLQT